jgi:hypothetical protein
MASAGLSGPGYRLAADPKLDTGRFSAIATFSSYVDGT